MHKESLFCMFLVGLVSGIGLVMGYMYLSENSPLMTRQHAFDNISSKYIQMAERAERCSEALNLNSSEQSDSQS
ncbi:TPA: hypothetical protein NGV86_004058 [Vibrio parahaemolyticus]|nr:hypothetical protein [Vibrio parahaemolyticus]